MKKIVIIIGLILISIMAKAQDVRETKTTILQILQERDFIYDTPVLKLTEEGKEYLYSKSKLTDIAYKFVFDEDQLCTKIIWEIPSKESMLAIKDSFDKYYKCTLIQDNKWVEFNSKKHGSLYYVLDSCNDGWTLTIW